MLMTLIRLYRMNPFRPHCDSRNGVHAWTCKLAMPLLSGVMACGEQPSNSPHWRHIMIGAADRRGGGCGIDG